MACIGFDIESQGRTMRINRCLSKSCHFIFLLPLRLALYVILTAFVLSFLAIYIVILVPLAALSFSVIPWGTNSETSSELQGMEGMYRRSRQRETFMARVRSRSLILLARATFVLLLVLLLSTSVARLKMVTLLGSPLWKWSLLAVILTAGYFQVWLIVLLVSDYVPSCMRDMGTPYYYLSGLGTSMKFGVYFGTLLGSWLLYFGTEHGLKQASTPHPQAFDYVTWTLVSLFAGSILCLFKAVLLARWCADAIYRRFEPRILITSLKFFFIGLTAGRSSEDRIVDELGILHEIPPGKLTPTLTKHVMSRKMGLNYLDYVCSLLMSLAEVGGPLHDRDDGDDILGEVMKWFEGKVQKMKIDTTKSCSVASLQSLITRDVDNFKEVLNGLAKMLVSAFRSWVRGSDFDVEDEDIKTEKMAHVLYQIVKEELSTKDSSFTFDEFKKWMVDAHKDCINMGRTLVDAKAIVTRLDVFMSSIIFVIVLLFWLLITEIASAKALATIATPFLALTFIFGDTAKTIFQGLIFCFATHPLDVGDRCVLDETELEVKSVNVLTTTFIKIGSNEKRLYPNSVLATKSIINLGFQPDTNDVVEITIDSSVDLKDLENEIAGFFKETSRYKEAHKVMVKEVGDSTKVTVQFTHVLTFSDLSQSQCFWKKSEQRTILLKEIQRIINMPNRVPVKVNKES